MHNESALKTAQSAQQNAENHLANTEAIFRLLIDAVDEYAIFVLDPSGFILSWNAGGERLKGYLAHEIIGSHFSRFYTQPDIDRKHPDFELKQAAQFGKYEEEGWRVKKDGSQFWANVVITALRDKNGELRGFGKVTRDLTQRRNAELRIRESEEHLRKSHAELESKVEERTRELYQAKEAAEKAVKARDEFFSIASHELKTPLSSLKLQAQMRKRNIEKGRTVDLSIDTLHEQCVDDERQIEKLTFLVDNMMDVSRLTSGRFELYLDSVDAKELAEDAMVRMEPILSETGNTVSLRAEAGIVGQWDRNRLEQVFNNLLANAGKYAPGTDIEIKIERKQGDIVQISVRDHGPGIDDNDRLRIFNSFERLKNKGQTTGLGLGLYINKQIIDAHHGDIHLANIQQDGAQFVITLPTNHNPSTGKE